MQKFQTDLSRRNFSISESLQDGIINFYSDKIRKIIRIESDLRILEFRKCKRLFRQMQKFQTDLSRRNFRKFRCFEMIHDKSAYFGRILQSWLQRTGEQFCLSRNKGNIPADTFCKILHHIGHPGIIIFQIAFFRRGMMKKVIKNFTYLCSGIMQRINFRINAVNEIGD